MDEPSPKRRRTSGAADVSSPSEAQRTSPRRRRPSYASPTRASMLRHNPEIIERREAAAAQEEAARAEEQTRSTAAQQTARRGGILAPPGQPQQSPALPPQQPLRRRDAEARRSNNSSRAPRADEPEDEDAEGEPYSEYEPRTNRPTTGVNIAPSTEPELPPTRPDPALSSPPKGIHNSPSRWKSKAKQKSSPLKKPPMRPGEEESEPRPVPTPQALQRRQNPPAGPAAGADEASRDMSRPDPERNVSSQDPDKLKERNALRAEFAQLQRDLEMATQENARLARTQDTGRYVAPANKDEILDLLRRSLIPADPLALPPQSQQLMMAALKPVGLLPFSKPLAAAVSPEKDDSKDIKSHHPIAMSAEDELPYLQLFSPFDVTSTIAALPATREHPFRQRRLLSLRSRRSLFQARIEMTVNPMTLAILELRVAALEPAAQAEVQPFADMVCEGRCNRSMQRNVGVLFWAMAEWHRAAVERAAVWARLDEEMLAKGGPAQAAAAMRRRARQGEEQADVPPRGDVSLKAAELRYLMGRQTYDIPIETGDQRNGAHVRLEWKIGFDWTGEAESKLAVLVGVPGKWRRVDRRGSLGKLCGLFQDLVRGGEDVDVATRKVAALLVGATDD